MHHSDDDPRSPTPAEDDGWLDATLRESLSEHIDDAGFATRVSARLPRESGGASRWRLLVIGGGAVVGLIAMLVRVRSGGGSLLTTEAADSLGQLSQFLAVTAQQIGVPWAAMATWAVCGGFAVVTLLRAWRQMSRSW